MTSVRRNAARPRAVDAAHPSVTVMCPRHLWPTLWTALVDAACNLWTGTAQPSPNPACNDAAPIELFLTPRGVEVAGRYGVTPHQNVLTAPADRLNAAIARELERMRALQPRGNP